MGVCPPPPPPLLDGLLVVGVGEVFGLLGEFDAPPFQVALLQPAPT